MKNTNSFILLILNIITTAALGAAARPNYDAFWEEAPTGSSDERLGTTTFLWAPPHNHSRPQPFSQMKRGAAAKQEPRARLVERTTRDFLAHNGARLGLTKRTIAQARLDEVHNTARGPIIARYQQTHRGLEVFGRRLNVMVDQELQPVAAAGYFAPDDTNDQNNRVAYFAPDDTNDQNNRVAALSVRDEFRQDLRQAISSAVADLGGHIDPATLEASGERGEYSLFRVTQSSGPYQVTGTPRGKRVYFPLGELLIPAWYLEVTVQHQDSSQRFSYGYVIGAADGRILFRNNHIAHQSFSYRVFADAGDPPMPFDSPLGNDRIPLAGLDPKINLPHVTAVTNLITLEHGPIANNDPWLPAGATETVGNNVDAYVDLAGRNGRQIGLGDFRAQVSSLNSFDYPVLADQDPTTTSARHAAVVNLFYINNFLHDWWYGNGFDEAAGNAQTDNYGRGGIGGDPIFAEGQDYSDRSNADMDTPADGASPRMQMYLWDGSIIANTFLSASGLGALVVNNADFGPAQFDLSAKITTVIPADACAILNNTSTITGKIALIDRGDCIFVKKVIRAQQAGAIGVIIANDVDDKSAPAMGGREAKITIPVLSTSFTGGVRIKNAIKKGTVMVTMHRTRNIDLDGALDTTIVAHEWFHYVSNRLVGDSNGLYNTQGLALGEGWSDMCALLIVARPEDATLVGNAGFNGAYPLATYVEPSTYFGIRRAPYSTDPAIFPLTFKHLAKKAKLPTTAPLAALGGANSEAHNAGEIWANILWDFYVSVLNDPRHSFLQAQELMKDYLIASLKMTPISPTFVESRNALLAAVKATDRTDFDLALRSFAKYGMGADAVAPARNSKTNEGVVESFVVRKGAYEVLDQNIDTTNITGCSDTDQVLDVGETAILKIRIRDIGTLELPTTLTANVTTNADVVLGNNGRILFSAFDAEGIATGTIPITLNSAATAATLKLIVTFLQVGDTPDTVREPPALAIKIPVNYDLQPALTIDDVEQIVATTADWSPLVTATGKGWQVTNKFNVLSNTGYSWVIPDNDIATDATLTSPAIQVGTQALLLHFDTLFQFEIDWEDGLNYSYDGGVVEVKVDDSDWQDVLVAGGQFLRGGYNSKVLAFAPDQDISKARPGFGRFHSRLTPQIIDFGTTLAGHSVRFRFHAVSDAAVGGLGWLVDNIRVIGATNQPFSNVNHNVLKDGACRE